jgi:hypothetical protein
MLAVQLVAAFGVGEVPSLDALEEAGGELAAGVSRQGIEVGVCGEAGFCDKEEPARPGAVGFRMGVFRFRVVDSLPRVSIEEIQEEIALGSGAMRKFGGT